MRITKFMAHLILAATPMAASHQVYSTNTATGIVDPQAVGVDSQGNAIVAGTVGPGATGTNLFGPRGGVSDVKVVKLSQTGQVVWTTIIGGSGNDVATAVTVANGWIHVAIDSASNDFPGAPAGSSDGAVVITMNSAGGLAYSRRIPGAGPSKRIFADSSNNVYIAGKTTSASFVQSGIANPLVPAHPGGYYVKLNGTLGTVFAGAIGLGSGTFLDFAANSLGFYILEISFLHRINGLGDRIASALVPNIGCKKVAMDTQGSAYLSKAPLGLLELEKRAVSGSSIPVVAAVTVVNSGASPDMVDDITVSALGEPHMIYRAPAAGAAFVNPLPGALQSASETYLVKFDGSLANRLLFTNIPSVPVGSRTSSLVANTIRGIYFTTAGTHSARIMESAADFRVGGIDRFKSGFLDRNSTMVVRVRNLGPEASSATFTADVPGVPVSVSATAGTGSCNLTTSNQAFCSFPNIAAGAFADVTITTRPPSSGSLEASPTVSGAKPDPNTADNTISYTFLP